MVSYDWANGGSVDVFLTVSMVLLIGSYTIIGNGYGI